MGPFAFFTAKKILLPKMRNRLLALLGLGGLQGMIGWWMVKSGLKEKPDYQDRPRVSPYRLMTHLMMATAIYSGILYNAFTLLIKPIAIDPNNLEQLRYLKKMRIIGIVMIKCLILNIMSGALVAGIDAGKV
jgi:cytochrome c oxidase assembly protein subunit 15